MLYRATAFAIDDDGYSGNALVEASGEHLPTVLSEIASAIEPDAFDEALRGEIIVEMA